MGEGRVMVVDDEPMVREVVGRYLQRDGFEVVEAADGAEAVEAAQRLRLDLVILDVMLPHLDGMAVLDVLRQGSVVPVILLSARRDEADRVMGLEAGADDYVVKPFSPRELMARVRSVLRRVAAPQPDGRLTFDGLSIDTATRETLVEGERVELTAREFDLLSFLASHPRQVFSRGQLLQQVWDSSPDWQDPATVTVHVRRVRNKIEVDPSNPMRLVTVWGVGYRFDP